MFHFLSFPRISKFFQCATFYVLPLRILQRGRARPYLLIFTTVLNKILQRRITPADSQKPMVGTLVKMAHKTKFHKSIRIHASKQKIPKAIARINRVRRMHPKHPIVAYCSEIQSFICCFLPFFLYVPP